MDKLKMIPDDICIRSADASDIPFMTEMLLEAAKASLNLIPPEELHKHPDTEMYVRNWPCNGEVGVIAEDDSGNPVGAAWLRIFPEPSHVVKYPMPELTVSVKDGYRRKGIARKLMSYLYQVAADAGIYEICLGVHHLNRAAIALYQKDKWVVDGTINNGEYIMMSREV